MARISVESMCEVASTSAVADFRYCHQSSGFCSAQPLCFDIIGASLLGKKVLATHLPVSASTMQAFTDELPIS